MFSTPQTSGTDHRSCPLGTSWCTRGGENGADRRIVDAAMGGPIFSQKGKRGRDRLMPPYIQAGKGLQKETSEKDPVCFLLFDNWGITNRELSRLFGGQGVARGGEEEFPESKKTKEGIETQILRLTNGKRDIPWFDCCRRRTILLNCAGESDVSRRREQARYHLDLAARGGELQKKKTNLFKKWLVSFWK